MKKGLLRTTLWTFVLLGLVGTIVWYVRYEHKKKVYQNSPTYQYQESLRKAICEQRVRDAEELLIQGLKNKLLSSRLIKTLEKELHNPLFTEAYKATLEIVKLKNTGLSRKIVFPIAFLKESHLLDTYLSRGSLYFPERVFGREVQWDPATKSLFIHCGTHGVKKIGEGAQKIVTKTVLYSKKKPEVFARGLTERDIAHEVRAMKQFPNVEGLISAKAFLEHIDPDTKKRMIAIVTPIFNHGSLQSVLKDKTLELNFKERLQIAQNLITGLAALHTKGYVHRDLGARNHFVTIEGDTKNKRTITAVIADLEKVIPAKDLHGDTVQGNSSYLCPEGIFREDMKGDMYFASDLFAVGCVFWRLYFDAMPPWSTLGKNDYRFKERPQLEQVCKDYIAKIEAGRKEAEAHLSTITDPTKRKFLEVILQMTHPDPAQRGSAIEMKTALQSQ